MEYQYYEFQAIDRPLTKTEQDYVRSLSSRVRPTATRAVFTYSYSDFHGDPLSVLEKCFDAMLYMANWGSYQLAFRFPRSAINPAELTPYYLDNVVEVSKTAKHVILNIEIHEEEPKGGWIEEDNPWLSALLPLREAILQGDYRVLYLAWLQAAAVSDDLREDTPEPPVPANLQKLSAPLQSFADWLDMDPDLIAVAAQASSTQQDVKEPFLDWVNALSEKEKTKLLLEIVTGDSAIASQIKARLRQKFATAPEPATPSKDRRSFAALSQLADAHKVERLAKEKAAAAAKRRKYLQSLKPRQAQIWETIEALIARKQAQPYDQAVQHLVDLRDLAALEGDSAVFQARIRQMKTDYSNRTGLLRRMREARLLRGKL